MRENDKIIPCPACETGSRCLYSLGSQRAANVVRDLLHHCPAFAKISVCACVAALTARQNLSQHFALDPDSPPEEALRGVWACIVGLTTQ